MIHQKHSSVLPGNSRPVLHFLRSRILLCCAFICTSFCLCYSLIHLPGNSVGTVRTDVLIFKAHGLNLTSINTRPRLKKSWQYIFFVECGRTPSDENKEAVHKALNDLRQVTETCRDLGTWKDQLSASNAWLDWFSLETRLGLFDLEQRIDDFANALKASCHMLKISQFYYTNKWNKNVRTVDDMDKVYTAR